MTEISTLYRQQNFKGDRIIIELTLEDAQELFWELGSSKRDPIAFLKWSGQERRKMEAARKKAFVSVLLGLAFLFFFRRFIP